MQEHLGLLDSVTHFLVAVVAEKVSDLGPELVELVEVGPTDICWIH